MKTLSDTVEGEVVEKLARVSPEHSQRQSEEAIQDPKGQHA